MTNEAENTLAVLDLLEQLASEASPGPWSVVASTYDSPEQAADGVRACISRGGDTVHALITGMTLDEAHEAVAKVPPGADAGIKLAAITGNGPTSDANARFIAAARLAVPELVTVVRGLLAENAELRGQLNEALDRLARVFLDVLGDVDALVRDGIVRFEETAGAR